MILNHRHIFSSLPLLVQKLGVCRFLAVSGFQLQDNRVRVPSKRGRFPRGATQIPRRALDKQICCKIFHACHRSLPQPKCSLGSCAAIKLINSSNKAARFQTQLDSANKLWTDLHSVEAASLPTIMAHNVWWPWWRIASIRLKVAESAVSIAGPMSNVHPSLLAIVVGGGCAVVAQRTLAETRPNC